MLLLEAFITYHATTFSTKLRDCIRGLLTLSSHSDAYLIHSPHLTSPTSPLSLPPEASQTDTKARDVLIETRDLSVTKSVIKFTEAIDHLTALCCLVMNETPPTAQVRLLGGAGGTNSGSGNDYSSSGSNRRGSLMSNRGGGGGGASHGGQIYNYGLQLDIERMFSRKIKVYDVETFQLNTECILGTILKVIRLSLSISPLTVSHSIGLFEIVTGVAPIVFFRTVELRTDDDRLYFSETGQSTSPCSHLTHICSCCLCLPLPLSVSCRL
jgi:hypothetical protein